MKKFVKSIVALSIFGAISISAVQAAQYKIEPITEVSSHKYTYGQFQNGNSQEYLVSATSSYNYPVIVQYLFKDLVLQQDSAGNIYYSFTYKGAQGQTLTLGFLEDPEAYLSGTPTARDLELSITYLQVKKGNLTYQQIEDQSVFVDLGTGAQQVSVWDKGFSLEFPALTRSTEDYLNGISSNGWLYGSGSAPHLPFSFSDIDTVTTYWLSEFDLKAYVSVDNGTTILPVESPINLYGGVSAILDMAEVDGNQVAVGYASIAYNEQILNGIENSCLSGESNVIQQNACIEELRDSLYYLNAFKWTFDNNGNVIDSEILGQLITPHVDDTRLHGSYATAINSSGVAVGYSTGWFQDKLDAPVTNPKINEAVTNYAVIFKDGEVFDFTDDHTEFYNSRANDINDNGIAVGYVTKSVLGDSRTQFYYIDTNKADLEMVMPTGFFNGSSSTARAINENGFIVGDAEVENHTDSNSNPRRRNGFLYDINTDTLTNLNDFLECNLGYEIIEARDINDLNEITATAVKKVESRDAQGEIELDDDGNIVYEDVLKAVKLTPLAGEIVNCDAEEGKLTKRQGASFSWLLILLSGFISIARRFK